VTRADPTQRARRSGAAEHVGLRVALDPLAWILALAGFFDGISDNWLHAALLMGAAVAVWWDAWLEETGRASPDAPPLVPRGIPVGRRRLAVLVGCTVAVLYCVVVGSFERYTWPVTVAILLPATVGLVASWRGPLYDRATPPRVSRLSVLGWSTVLVLAGLWELGALLLQPTLQLGSSDHPTISYMMDTVLAGHLGRSVTLLAWLALGWWLLGLAPAGPVPRPGAGTQAAEVGEPGSAPGGEPGGEAS